MPLPHRPLGKTGVQVPILGYGTAPLGKIKLMDAPLIHKSARLLNHAIDRGITYLDTSPDYGSQPKLGEVMATRRDEVFLATKVNKRRRDDVLKELRQNLKELQTDHVDLVQVHAVNTMADLEAALAPDGAVSALEEARRQGMTRFVGITGHARPWVLARALERYDFDTVLVAIGRGGPAGQRPRGGPAAGGPGQAGGGHRHEGLRPRRAQATRAGAALRPRPAGRQPGDRRDGRRVRDRRERPPGGVPHPAGQGELDTLLEEAKGLLEGDEPSDHSPVFWIYDTKTMAWKEDSEPTLARY